MTAVATFPHHAVGKTRWNSHLMEDRMNGFDAPTTGTAEEAVAADSVAEELIEADDLIEEVSIDGMCGVY